ncbi:hypothetical protein Q3309_18750 [Clostridioides difficile]
MITNIYKNNNESNESDELCVDICEILYNILNQFYNFTKIIEVKEIKDIAKISNTNDFKKYIYVDMSNYAGSKRTVLRRLNMEAFINLGLTIVTVIPSNLLKFVSNTCMNTNIEYVPKTLVCNNVEIELEDDLVIVTFNQKDKEHGNNEY